MRNADTLPNKLRIYLIKRFVENRSKICLKKKEKKKKMKHGSTVDNSKMIYDEEREVYIRDEASDSKEKWEKIGLKLEGYSLCVIESYTLAKQDMEVLMDEGNSESTISDLNDMCYTGDKESNIQDFGDEDLVDKECLKEEINMYIVDGLRVPHDGLKKLHDGDEEATTLVEIDLTSTPLDEPNINLVKEALRQRYTLKSQDIIGINDEMFKYSCWTNSR
jgi:uncharacterized DUF497 family protein